jgi:hypothetical protein
MYGEFRTLLAKGVGLPYTICTKMVYNLEDDSLNVTIWGRST